MSKGWWLLLIFIIVLSGVLRLYKLSDIPVGLYADEASIGYNAYSILKTGRDEHGFFFPLWFRAFGEYKLPVYIYLTGISEYVFGKNEFAVRFSSAVAGVLSTIFIFFLVDCFFSKSHKFSLLSSFLFSIMPWSIQFSRGGFEANLMLFFILLGIYLFVNGRIISSFIVLALSFYTYNAARIITSLLILILFFLKERSISIKKNIVALFILIILIIPFLIFSISSEGLTRALSVNYFYSFTPKNSISLVRYFEYVEGFLRNYFQHFSLDFLFISGDQHGRHGVRALGLLYIWQIPFLISGLSILKSEKFLGKILAWLLIIAPIAAAVSTPNPHALRSLVLVVPLSIIVAYGLAKIRLFFIKIGVVLIAVYFLVFYLHIYYRHYPKITYLDWGDGYKKLYSSLAKYKDKYTKIVINKEYPQSYIYLLFYAYEPERYHNQIKRGEIFGNYVFGVNEQTLGKIDKLLYVSGPNDNVEGRLLENIYFIDNNIAFKIWEL